MKTQRIKKGLYLTDNGYMIQLKNNKWIVWNQVTGEVYAEVNSKKEAVNYCNV